MPLNTDMKFKLIMIDNALVPAVLPQIWSEQEEDWIVTGEDNPVITNLKEMDEYTQLLKTADTNSGEALDILESTVVTMQNLIDNSVRERLLVIYGSRQIRRAS